MTLARIAVAVTLLSILCGCDAVARFGSAVDRINAAIPPSPELVVARQSLRADIASDKTLVGQEEARWQSRMKIRALTCGRGYEPGVFTSAAAIRSRFTDHKCFDDADADLLRRTGLARVKIALSQPPKPIPQQPVAMLGHRESIQSVAFARNAPVAAIRGPRSVAIVDLTDGHVLFDGEAASDSLRPVQPSPNGRLWTEPGTGGTAIRTSERGDTLVQFPGVRDVVWVDDTVVLAVPSDGKPIRVIDLWSAEESPLSATTTFDIFAARPIPAENDRFVLLGVGPAVRFELVERDGRRDGRVTGEQQGATRAFARNTGEISVDGATWVSGFQELSFLGLADLALQKVALSPLRAQRAWPTPDRDRFLLLAFMTDANRVTSTPRWFVYARDAGTLAPVALDAAVSTQFVWMEPIRRLGVIEGQRIRLLETPKAGEAAPVAVVTGALQADVNERRLAAATAPDTAAPMASNPREPGLRDGTVEAIGVYRGRGAGVGANVGARAHETGYVEVRIKRTARPIALVLSSYEPVRWLLITEPGAKLGTVLVSSHYPSTVVGAGTARVVQIGQAHAYRRDSREFGELQQLVAQWTGQASMLFQGRYEGATFEVGGS